MTQLAMFDPPPQPIARRPVEPIVRSALVVKPYRFKLGRAWDAHKPCVAFGMLNPSTADGKQDDPTLLTIMGFAYRWGFGGLVVGNIYPFQSSSQAAMRFWRSAWSTDHPDPDWSARDAFQRNTHICRDLFADCTLHIAAWGNGADPDDLQAWLDVVEATVEFNWHCLGTTLSGAPKHPLARGVHRIPADQKPIPWGGP